MSKKIVIKADLVGAKCRTAILSTVAKLKGITSMDTDAETSTLTILGAVDPVAIVSVEDDNQPEPAAETSEEEERAACQCHEAATAVVQLQACVPGCYYRPSALPDCCYDRGAFRAAPCGYGYVCCDERPVMGGGGECAIQ